MDLMEQEKPVFSPPDPALFAKNMLAVTERGAKLIQSFLRQQVHRLSQPPELGDPFQIKAAAPAFLELARQMLGNPGYFLEAQRQLWPAYLDLWQTTLRRMLGEEARPVVKPDPADKRFRAKEWSEGVIFDFIKQSYLLSANWLMQTVTGVEGMDPANARKAAFYTRQFADALSPSNFVLTNPEILRATFASNGENLMRGLENLLEDLERGQGRLAIRMTNLEAFEVGRNIALTPGKVIFRNDLIELIQYTPTTDTVYQRPLLIFPPWINKYYILDLTAEKSFIRWAVAQGYTVFTVSWANPDAKLAGKTFESYLMEGVYAALDAVEQATGEREVNAIGYCIGGTLLTAALAHMAARGKRMQRIKAATFFAAQADFSEAGELKVFIDEEQIGALEKKMDAAGGLLESSEMANTFNMLRSNDLIWSFVVNNYLLGKEPAPFDLLYGNAICTTIWRKAQWCWAARSWTFPKSPSRYICSPRSKIISRPTARYIKAPNCCQGKSVSSLPVRAISQGSSIPLRPINISTGPMTPCPMTWRNGAAARPNIPAPGGRTGMNGTAPEAARRSRPAFPAPASCPFSRTRRAAMSR
jgi:polyhydroxyalkanoate synthase subunit PhaC